MEGLRTIGHRINDLMNLVETQKNTTEAVIQAINLQEAKIDSIIGTLGTTATFMRDLTQLTGQSTQNVDNFVNTVRSAPAVSASGSSQDKNYVTRPTAFDGEGDGSEARFFLAAFANWAQASGRILNRSAANGQWVKDEQKWIAAALNLLSDKARSWALPSLEKVAKGQQAYSSWSDFEDAFRKRFEPVDVLRAAQVAIKALRQGAGSVEAYKAKFDEHAPRCQYPDNVLAEIFYHALTDRVKDVMLGITHDKQVLDSVSKAALEAGERIRQRDGEKRYGGSTLDKGKSSAGEPMEIDASRMTGNNGSPYNRSNQAGPNGKTFDDWKRALVNKCNRCGSTAHVAKDGNHEKDVCNWCGKGGHRSSVCQRKFMGHPATPANKIAGTSSSSSLTDQSSEALAAAALDKKEIDAKAEAAKRRKEMEDQISALRKEMESIKAAF